jgi:hypothetical protein
MLIASSVVIAGTSVAAAHSDQGLMEVTATPGAQPLSAEVRAKLVYANDRDPVSSASVTVEAIGPAGEVLSVPLASQGEGVYTGVVQLPAPGSWQFRATAGTPSAVAETVFEASTSPTTTSPAAVDAVDRESVPVVDRSGGSDGGGSGWFVPAMFGLIIVIVVVGFAVAWSRRRRASAH